MQFMQCRITVRIGFIILFFLLGIQTLTDLIENFLFLCNNILFTSPCLFLTQCKACNLATMNYTSQVNNVR